MRSWLIGYLAEQIGTLKGLPEDEVQCHREALEQEALKALYLPQVEDRLMDVLRDVAAAWIADQERRAAIRRHWERLLNSRDAQSAPTEAPVEAQQAR